MAENKKSIPHREMLQKTFKKTKKFSIPPCFHDIIYHQTLRRSHWQSTLGHIKVRSVKKSCPARKNGKKKETGGLLKEPEKDRSLRVQMLRRKKIAKTLSADTNKLQ